MPNNETSLDIKIKNWLETQGYPLEMNVAQAFQGVGAHVIQSEYYVDAATSDSREIDVVAYWQDDIDGILVRISLVIECKSSKDKPWILFVSNKTHLASPARVAQRAASHLGRVALTLLCQNKSIQALPLFQIPEMSGYSLTQAFTSGHDVCYAAATAVANAAAALVSETDSQNTRYGQLDLLEIIFPVVVTEARLFTASLESDSTLSTSEQSSGVLLWRNPLIGSPHTIIHIVSVASLAEFVETASESAKQFLELCRGKLRPQILQTRGVKGLGFHFSIPTYFNYLVARLRGLM